MGCWSFRLSAFEVQVEQVLKDLAVGEVGRPVVGGEDGGVEGGVGVVEPGGALVVEVGEGPLLEIRRLPALLDGDAAGRKRQGYRIVGLFPRTKKRLD